MTETFTLNLDDLTAKRLLMSRISIMHGLWDVTLKQRKKLRTLDQSAYYFAAVVSPFCDWLREEWGEPGITKDQAHEMLKQAMLAVQEKEIDGKVFKLPSTTTTLTTAEFSEYVENCARWLATFANIVVIPSELFYEGATDPKPRSKRQPSNEHKQEKEHEQIRNHRNVSEGAGRSTSGYSGR